MYFADQLRNYCSIPGSLFPNEERLQEVVAEQLMTESEYISQVGDVFVLMCLGY